MAMLLDALSEVMLVVVFVLPLLSFLLWLCTGIIPVLEQELPVFEAIPASFRKKRGPPASMEALIGESRLRVERVQGPSGKVYGSTSVWGLRPGSEPRRSSIRIVETWLFDPIILTTILANCATMAWQSPLDPCCTWKERVIGRLEWVFLLVFTAELLIKVTAYGLVLNRGSYLRDSWCQLDFTVVSLAWLPIIFPQMGNYSVLRAFRALRPLRALKRLPGMPVLVQWILSVLPKMGNVLMLMGFLFAILGIVGMELFKGALHHRCAYPGPMQTVGHPTRRQLVQPSLAQSEFDTEIACNPFAVGDAPGSCPNGTTCAYFDANPGGGLNSFDSVPLSFISFVQMVTFDDWATTMYYLMASFSPYVWIYFLLGLMLGGCFIINLFLAVIFLEYDTVRKETKSRDQPQMMLTEQTPLQQLSLAASPSTDATDGTATKRVHLEDIGQLVGVQSEHSEQVEQPRETELMKAVRELVVLREKAALLAQERAALRCGFKAVATSDTLSNFSTFLVLLNMVLMCMPYEGMPVEYASRLEGAATVITWLFIAELVLKIAGLGCAEYWSDNWNRLDGTIVALSILEMVATELSAGSGVKLSFLRMLRMLRVLRVLRLMRKWRGLYTILRTFINALPQMGNLIILIVLLMFIFSLLGMQLFGGMYSPSSGYSPDPCPGGVCPDPNLLEKPPYHFDYCYPAMLTIFVLLTGEWVDVTESAAHVVGPGVSIFFILVVLLGKYLLVNLLVAVILGEFGEDEEPRSRATSRASSEADSEVARNLERDLDDSSAPNSPSMRPHQLASAVRPRKSSLKWLIHRPWFDQVVIVAIIASSICLAVDSPRVDPASELAHALAQLNLFFTIFFVCEMLIKVCALGFPGYIRNSWNKLDFLIVCISLLVLLADSIEQLRPLRVLRVMRVLRPLRLVSRNMGMKLIVNTLFRVMPAVGNVFGVVLMLQVVFVILGMQLFSGTFASCSDPTILTKAECIGAPLSASDAIGGAAGEDLRWANPSFGSFDNFGSGMQLLYIMSSADGWGDHMSLMMAATEPGTAPSRNDFSLMALFPLTWMFMGFTFAINLFIGVVVDNFSRMQREEDGSALMTHEQKQWVEAMKAVKGKRAAKSARPPSQPVRNCLYKLVQSNFFDTCITTVIVANIAGMTTDYWGIEQDETAMANYEVSSSRRTLHPHRAHQPAHMPTCPHAHMPTCPHAHMPHPLLPCA